MTEEKVKELVEHFQNAGTDESKEAAIHGLSIFLYTSMERIRIRIPNEDRKSDFITWLYPRLGNIIERYNPVRSRFSTYLRHICMLYFRTFLRRQYRTAAEEAVFSDPEFVQSTETYAATAKFEEKDDFAQVAEIETSYKSKPLSEHAQALRRKKILLLACKSAPFMDDILIAKVGKSTGYGEDSIRHLTEELNKECFKKICQNRVYQQKRNFFFLRTRRCEIELTGMDTTTNRYAKLEKEYQYCRTQWQRSQKKSWSHSHVPSNRTIARITGICRGTVDSTLATAVRDGYAQGL